MHLLMVLILLNFGWMVDLGMSIFEFLTKFLILWPPWHPWVTVVLRCRWEKKNVHGVWVVPNDSSTFSVLENQENEIFQRGLFEDAKAKGGRLVEEADFEAEKKIKQKKI
jgi:hypothetical protein